MAPIIGGTQRFQMLHVAPNTSHWPPLLQLLDYERVELLFVGASKDLAAELGECVGQFLLYSRGVMGPLGIPCV